MEENGKPLVPDDAPPPRVVGKVNNLDPDYVCEVIHDSNGNLDTALKALNISYPSLRKLRKKYPKVNRAFLNSRKKDRPEWLRDRLMTAAKYDDKLAFKLAERLCPELAPTPKKVEVGVGQDPHAGPIQHQHTVGVVNIVPRWDQLPLEARRMLIEMAREQGVLQIQSVVIPPVESEPKRVELDDSDGS